MPASISTRWLAGTVLAAMGLSSCGILRSDCMDKKVSEIEAAAVQDLMVLNGLDKEFRANRVASQHDVDGCTTGHIQQVTAGGMGIDTIPPSIAALGKVQTLLLDQNELRNLPREIVGLNPLTVAVSGNMLCDLDSAVSAWLTHHQPGWDSTQTCP